MLALVLPTLFAASALLALGAIGSSWRSFGSAAFALHRQVEECTRTRELRYTVITTTVGSGETRPGATIYRVDFSPASQGVALRLPKQPGLRAAA